MQSLCLRGSHAAHIITSACHECGDKMNQKHVSKSQFKARVLEYLRNIETTGEALVITDRGNPVVELRPYRPYKRCPLEVLSGSVIEYKEPFEPVIEDGWDINKGV